MRDITADQFDAEVIEASRSKPVVVDFWAPWCGPCHQLSPVLERVAQRHASEVDAVKLNVDTAQDVARRYGIQGIPAVKAFQDGKVVGEFVGVQAEPAIEKLFAGLAPSQADRLVEQARDLDAEKAETLLREAVELQRDHAPALVGLSRLLIDRGADDEARQLLGRVPQDAAARRLLAQLDLGAAGDGAATEGLDELRRAAVNGDARAALRLGRALAAGEDYAEALPTLLTAVRDADTRDEARDSVLTIFALLGDDSEIVRTWRPKLAAALF